MDGIFRFGWGTCGEMPDGYRYLGPAIYPAQTVDLVPHGELAALKERDAAFEMRNEAVTALRAAREHIGAAVDRGRDERKILRDEIAALTAENARLHDILAQRPAPAVPDPQKPAILNAIRPRDMDRRRVGG